MFSTSLVAVPAFRRVDPAITSAPTPGAIVRSTNVCSSVPGIAGDEDDARAGLARPRQRAAHELRHPAGRHADDDVLLRRSQAGDRARALFVVVLDAFLGAEDGLAAAGHDRLHERRIGAEGRRHLRRLENAEPAARAGADEDDAAVLAQCRGDHLDADRDPLLLALDGREHLAIFVDHQVDDVVGLELVDAEARGVDCFGGERLPLRSNGHTATILHSGHLRGRTCVISLRRRWSTPT